MVWFRHRRLVYRHALPVRLTHWVTAGCLVLLLMSGLQIFNAHPALYWGEASDFSDPVLAVERGGGPALPEGAAPDALLCGGAADGTTGGRLILFGGKFETSALCVAGAGGSTIQAIPNWATMPGWGALPQARHWHFFFAWIFVVSLAVYLLYTLFSGHLFRDLIPGLRDIAAIPRSIGQHLRLRFRNHGARYNPLQKLTYLVVAIVLLPGIVLTGLTMSPGFNAAMPWLVELFGGRQSARTIHFLIATLLVLFVAVHVVMVLVSGVFNNLRSMITGWYAVRQEDGADG